VLYREIVYIVKGDFNPIEEFIVSLDVKTRSKILDVFDKIENQINPSIDIFKKLKGTRDIWEIRVLFNKRRYRFLGFYYKGSLVILTNAFVKKSDKIPKKEIKLAEQRKKEFLVDNPIKN